MASQSYDTEVFISEAMITRTARLRREYEDRKHAWVSWPGNVEHLAW